MADVDREQWIAILEAASVSSPDELNAEWEWLMKELGLPLDWWLAVREAIQQGRWRKAKNPRGYVKTVTKREAIKLGLVESTDKNLVMIRAKEGRSGGYLSSADILGYLAFTSTSSEATQRPDGVFRRGDGSDNRSRPEWDYEFDSPWDYLLSKLPKDLKVDNPPPPEIKAAYDTLNAMSDDFHIHMRTPVSPNWKAWGKRAGLDEWEQLALECRVSRKSREKALAEQPNETSRKALQAGWKRFDRTGMERLANALK